MPRLSEFLVASAMNAVPEARRFAAGALADVAADAIDNVQLLVSELVTNALFHGQPPVLLRLIQQDHTVRVEVEDTGHALPVEMASSGESMTGRGLALVSTLSSGWGVQRTATGGKVVWAQLSETPSIRRPCGTRDGRRRPAGVLGERRAGRAALRGASRLGADGLLLEAKGHIENLVRELTLAKAGETAKGTSLPVAMAELVTTVISEFSDARSEIKRQALAAAGRGEATTELVMNLPISAADAGERYLAALDEADRYARAARLLTLAAPRSHQIFRRWYIQSLVDQLRAVAKGERADRPSPSPPRSPARWSGCPNSKTAGRSCSCCRRSPPI